MFNGPIHNYSMGGDIKTDIYIYNTLIDKQGLEY